MCILYGFIPAVCVFLSFRVTQEEFLFFLCYNLWSLRHLPKVLLFPELRVATQIFLTLSDQNNRNTLTMCERTAHLLWCCESLNNLQEKKTPQYCHWLRNKKKAKYSFMVGKK